MLTSDKICRDVLAISLVSLAEMKKGIYGRF